MPSNRVKILLVCLLTSIICYILYTKEKKNETFMLNDARASFVKIIIENEFIEMPCTEIELEENKCDVTSISPELYQIFGSGIIIQSKKGNNILTANHICEQMITGPVISPGGREGIIFSSQFAMTIDGMLQKIEVIKNDAENDICLLDFERNNEYRGIKLYNGDLIAGERIYNLAAPKGIFEPGNVLIFDGFYTGLSSNANNSMMFSIYAEQGSSGSAIINRNGKLISIVHSTLTIIDNATLGSNLGSLREFLKNE